STSWTSSCGPPPCRPSTAAAPAWTPTKANCASTARRTSRSRPPCASAPWSTPPAGSSPRRRRCAPDPGRQPIRERRGSFPAPFFLAAPPQRRSVGVGGLFDQLAHQVDHQLLLTRRQARRQTPDLDRLTRGGKVMHERLGLVLGHARLSGLGQALEEIADIHAEEAGDVPQFGRRDAVGALFILLHLLEGDPQRLTQIGLIIAQGDALLAHAPPDMPVHQMGTLRPRTPDHLQPLPGCTGIHMPRALSPVMRFRVTGAPPASYHA